MESLVLKWLNLRLDVDGAEAGRCRKAYLDHVPGCRLYGKTRTWEGEDERALESCLGTEL